MIIYGSVKGFFTSKKPLPWKRIFNEGLIEYRKSDDEFVSKTFIINYNNMEVQTIVYDPKMEDKFKSYVEFKWHKPEGGVLCAISLPEKDFNDFHKELIRKGYL